MSDLPTVGLVTPSYNTARFIGAAVQSVLDQAGVAIDHLVMDGGSNDGTVDVLRSFGGRVKWVSQPDRGQADAINRGFAQVKGDVLGWLNSDDAYAPNAVATAAAFLRDNPGVALVYGDAAFIDAAGNPIGPCVHVEEFSRRRLLHYSDFIVQPAAFWRRSAFEAVGGLDPSLNWAMDYDLWLKIAKRFKIAYLPKTLAHYRWLGDAKTASGGWGRLEEVERVALRHGAWRLPAFFRLEKIYLHVQEAQQAWRYADRWSSVASLTKAMGNFVGSPRAIGALFFPHTWRVIHTGQVLRKRAAAAQAATSPKPSDENAVK